MTKSYSHFPDYRIGKQERPRLSGSSGSGRNVAVCANRDGYVILRHVTNPWPVSDTLWATYPPSKSSKSLTHKTFHTCANMGETCLIFWRGVTDRLWEVVSKSQSVRGFQGGREALIAMCLRDGFKSETGGARGVVRKIWVWWGDRGRSGDSNGYAVVHVGRLLMILEGVSLNTLLKRLSGRIYDR